MRDLLNRINILPAINPAAATTDNTAFVSAIIDRKGFESLCWAILCGSLADADATFAVTMDEGDVANLSDAAAVAAGDMVGTLALASFTFAADNKTFKVGYAGNKRYVRLTITPSANTGNAFIAACAILGSAQQRPTVNPPA
jgi:hypothetical protein